jgi:hypothetical protein
MGSIKVTFERWGKYRSGYLGRFGGGWKYKLGVAVGGDTVIIDLLFGSIRIERRKSWKD